MVSECVRKKNRKKKETGVKDVEHLRELSCTLHEILIVFFSLNYCKGFAGTEDPGREEDSMKPGPIKASATPG